MADKTIFVRIVRLMNFICAIAMIFVAILRLFMSSSSSSSAFQYLMTFYLIGFSLLLIMAEIRYKKMLVYLEFLKGRLGKGFYVLLVGLLVFDNSNNADMALGVGLTLVGIFNLIVGCMRENETL